MAFTPDNRSLAVEKRDGSVDLWELAGYKVRRVFAPRTAPQTTMTYSLGNRMPALDATPSVSVAFSPNGDLLVHGARRGHPRLGCGNGRGTGRFSRSHGRHKCFRLHHERPDARLGQHRHECVDLGPLRLASRPKARREFTDAQLRAAWHLLADNDAEKAFAAMYDLAATPAQALPFLNQHLKPAMALNLGNVNRQLADLEGSTFKVREKAMADLLQLDTSVVPFIDKALASMRPLEVQLRLKKIRDQLTSRLLMDEALRQFRAVEVLEHIGTPEARRLLERLARGVAGSRDNYQCTECTRPIGQPDDRPKTIV